MAQGVHVTCIKEFRAAEVHAAAQYRSHIAELSGFAQARCASDAD
ncbi:hypothetical protein ACWGKW_04840 [Streptomyces sp. NPDC054766]